MYRFLLILLSVVGMATATDAQQRQDMSKGKSNNKILVTYFSATGTTARVAEKLANATGGELYAITMSSSSVIPFGGISHRALSTRSSKATT